MFGLNQPRKVSLTKTGQEYWGFTLRGSYPPFIVELDELGVAARNVRYPTALSQQLAHRLCPRINRVDTGLLCRVGRRCGGPGVGDKRTGMPREVTSGVCSNGQVQRAKLGNGAAFQAKSTGVKLVQILYSTRFTYARKDRW